jgi:UDP-glucose 4-epimerase
MNVLITGGAGFIGSHLAERLLRRGDHVCVVDNLSSVSAENLDSFRDSSRFRFVQGSVTDPALMGKEIGTADIVYHLAAAVGVQMVVDNPAGAIETNFHGTEVVLELAARDRTRVLVSSTSEVYGRRQQVPFREHEDLIIGPPDSGRWSYACSKLLDEFLAIAYWQQKQLPTVVTRLFNVVGPRQVARHGMVIPTLVQQALHGQSMTVFGDGTQRRCFSHVSDVVTGLIALAEHPQAVGQVFNVGAVNEITILDLARRIKELSGSRSEIELIPYDRATARSAGDMMRRIPDLTKIKNLTGYSPAKDIDAILRDTIEYQASRLSVSAPAFSDGGWSRFESRREVGAGI